MDRKIVNVYIDKGYLTLDSEDSLDLFADQVENGLIWQFISQLFNDYSKTARREEEITVKLDALLELQKMTLDAVKCNVTVVNKDKIVKPKENVIKLNTVTSKALKPSGSLFGGLTNKFKDFKD